MKIRWYDAGHMTNMAAMPLYGKNPSKIFLQQQADRFPRNLVCSIIVCSNNDPEVTLTYLYEHLPAKSKMAFLSTILILLAILLYEQYIHHTQARIRPNMQYLSAQQYAYQSFLSYFLV